MTTRREFISRTAIAGLAVAAAQGTPALTLGGTMTSRSTAAKRPRIRAAVRCEETILRLGGNGDNFHLTWTSDDRQYTAVCDGEGWSLTPKGPYNSRLFSISGAPQEAHFQEVLGYPDFTVWEVVKDQSAAPYYGFGTIAIQERIYQFLSTFSDGSAKHLNLHWNGAKLIYSPDNGRTWHNQSGSSPVVKESRKERSRENMVFFEESQAAFSLLTVLQMGQGYRANRDGYVYVYSPNGSTEGTMNELVMFRVAKTKLLDRKSYEFFVGLKADGSGAWSKDIEARRPIHTFPRGWVNKTWHPYAWHPSVVYNEPLDLYIMANWGMGCGEDPRAPGGDWFAKPSYLGFWSSATPWGPWIQFHEETSWTPGGDTKARAYQPQIAPKWITPDGKSFWLVWTDFQHTAEFLPTLGRAVALSNQGEFSRAMLGSIQHRPYYGFNVQRVELDIA